MKIQIICSRGSEKFSQRGSCIKTDGIFANKKFIPNLKYVMDNHLEPEIKNSSSIEIFHLPNEYPLFLDDPLNYLPPKFKTHQLTIAIGIHEDILMELPRLISQSKSRALIVPLENKNWLTKWVKQKVIQECEKHKIQYSFPKPFCALGKGEFSIINKFIDEFKIGKPRLRLFADKQGSILKTEVLNTTPCGNLYNIPKYLKGKKLGQEASDSAAKYWHGFSCLGDTHIDPELGDTIIHFAGHIHRCMIEKSETTVIST